MAVDRTVRNLSALAGASSSRVLNLTAIGLAQAGNAGHGNKPMFASRILNNAIVLKHRLRADEIDLFTPAGRWPPRSSCRSNAATCGQAAARCSWTSAVSRSCCARSATTMTKPT